MGKFKGKGEGGMGTEAGVDDVGYDALEGHYCCE